MAYQDHSQLARRVHPLDGGGAMGELMRSIDWSKTSVGPVESWPQSLKTALSILLENHFAMYIAWGDKYTQFYNDAYRPILGSTKHPQAMGLDASQTFAESWHIIGPMFDGVMAGNAVGSDNWMLPLDRHGFLEECYFNFSYSPIRDESGEVGGVLVTVAETTARVVGERRLSILQALASRTQLVTTRSEACTVIGQVLGETPSEIPAAILYLIDDDGETARLAGTAGQIEPAPPPLARLREPGAPWSMSQVAESGAARILEQEEQEGGGGNFARAYVVPIARSGEERPAGILVAATSPRLPFDDKYRGFLDLAASQIATTLGSIRALEEARARAAALAELDRAKTAFFSNVSHEFRTPLTLLLGPTEDALADPAPRSDADAQRWTLVHRNALRLLKLVNTLLDFSRIEAGRAQASYEPTNLTAYTRDLVSVFRAAVERAGIRLQLDLDPLESPVFVDHEMWEKVIFNLLSNALKFTFAGTISVSLRAADDAAVLTVRDTGVGIPAHELPFLFDRFHRVESTRGRTREGTGIGLALVRELIKLHGGSVDVVSIIDEGTVFSVTLPFGSAHLPADQVSAGQRALGSAIRADAFVSEAERWLPEVGSAVRQTSSSVQTARIVLADDNADMRDYVARLLRDRWIVEPVADGAAALVLVQSNPPDLVLADVMMPGLNGFELLKHLRADALTRGVPVIFLSARAGEEARVEGLQAGADDYLAKPFSARELMARVATHLELSRLRREAERAQARLREQFMQAPVAVSVVSGPDFLFELANPLYEEMVGRPALTGMTFREAFPELADDAPVLQMLGHVYETGETFQAEEFLVPLDRTGTGVIVNAYFKFTSQPLRNEHGAIDSIMTVAVDVTEQVQARQQVERQAAELDRLNRAKDEFLATLSHELRTPLTSILGWARLLRMEIGDAELRRTGLESIDQSAHVQAKVIDDVLDLSRITTGKVHVERERVNLINVASAALDGVQLAASAKGIVLERQFPADEPVLVLGDASRLQQVVWNLLTNAIKFTPEGGNVRLGVTATQSSVSLSVADDGMGIRSEFLPHVFETFRQADNSATRSHGGLGLGLSIVRHLTELHGGRAMVTSEGEGRGATFTLQLPQLREPPVQQVLPPSVAAALPNNVDARFVNLEGVSVLVIDDQEPVSTFFSATLRRNGANVSTASSVQEAFRAVEGNVPDVVLCDIAMPHQDGYAFLSWMLARPASRGVPVLAVTAFGRPEDEGNALAAGFRAYIRKPVDPVALARAVEAAISSRRD